MPLEITYWAARGDDIPIPGGIISSEARSLSGSSAQSGATPPDAVQVSIVATEKARFGYGSNPSVTDAGTSALIQSGERIWLTAKSGWKIAGIAAA
jgi:hypothetical protein